jgi:anti-anti-sigma regulatory factor
MGGDWQQKDKPMIQDIKKETTVTTETAATQHPTVIHCDTCLDISGVREFHGKLRHALEAQQPVVLNAAQVERIDTAVLQTLCAFFQDARAHGMVVQWQQPSLAVLHAARLLNVSACLALPMA